MQRTLRITLLVIALIGCLALQLSAHPASCGKNGCGCEYLGLAPVDKRVETDQRKEIILDWLVQDGMGEGLEVKKIWTKGSRFSRLALAGNVADVLDAGAVQKVVDGLGAAAGKLRADCDALTKGNVPAKDPRWATLYLAACEKRRELRLKPYREMLQRIVFTKHYEFGGTHYAYTEGLSDAQHEAHFAPGASLCLLEVDGLYAKVDVLLDDPGA